VATGTIMENAITVAIDTADITAVTASGIAQDSGSIFTVRNTGPIAIITKNLTAEEGIQATTTTATITRAMIEGITMATTRDMVGIRRITTITEGNATLEMFLSRTKAHADVLRQSLR
jgi:hypothetical protein